MLNALSHLVLPQESNNHRAKLLHHKSLFFFAIGILFFQVLFVTFKQAHPEVLGTATDISAQRLLELSNLQRSKNNLSPLKLNAQLSLAAERKAEDMYKSNYWAHFSPIGTTPWDFIKGAGYDYSYAGENLARGFNTSEDVVNAWMNSPSHKDNQLSPNYQDVGYAVDDGTLLGEHTTLVVEEFGAPAATNGQQEAVTPSPTIAMPQTVKITPIPTAAVPKEVIPTPVPQILAAKLKGSSLLDGSVTAKTISFLFLVLFIVLFIADAVIIERKNIARLIGNHVDHCLFFLLLLIFVILYTRGTVL